MKTDPLSPLFHLHPCQILLFPRNRFSFIIFPMITFSAIDGATFRLKGGERDVIAFPPSAAKAGDKEAIALLSAPEEASTPNAISWPGEYNEYGMSLHGVGHLEGQQVSYVADVDGVRMALLSAPLQDWTDAQLEAVGDVDVLVLPVSEPKLTQKLVDEFDPRILLLLPTGEKGALEAVGKVVGVKETVAEYKLKGSLPAEGREVYVLAA